MHFAHWGWNLPGWLERKLWRQQVAVAPTPRAEIPSRSENSGKPPLFSVRLFFFLLRAARFIYREMIEMIYCKKFRKPWQSKQNPFVSSLYRQWGANMKVEFSSWEFPFFSNPPGPSCSLVGFLSISMHSFGSHWNLSVEVRAPCGLLSTFECVRKDTNQILINSTGKTNDCIYWIYAVLQPLFRRFMCFISFNL